MRSTSLFFGMKRILLLYICCIIIVLGLTFFASEAAVRVLGHKPFSYVTYDPALTIEQRPMYQLDPVNGYIVKPGQFSFDYLPEGKHHIRVTIAQDGSRFPSQGTLPGHPYLYFAGCSICFGIGVDDEDIFSNVITRRTGYGNRNQCVGGYGTLQALERLQRAEATWKEEKPSAIVYMMATHHAWRNVVDGSWIIGLDQANRRENGFKLPYARLDEHGNVIVHPPTIYAAWPFRHYSALIYLLEKTYVNYTWDTTAEERNIVTLDLVLRMKEIATRQAIPFYVVMISTTDEDFNLYRKQFAEQGIPTVNCHDPRSNEREYQVPNDGHPNAIIHAYYAQCVIDNVISKLH